MVKHVLFVKLKDNSQQECQKLKDVIFIDERKRLRCESRDLQVGIDFLHFDRSYDVVLEIVLDSPAALEEYQAHPYHADIVKPYVHQMREASCIVDYEME